MIFMVARVLFGRHWILALIGCATSCQGKMVTILLTSSSMTRKPEKNFVPLFLSRGMWNRKQEENRPQRRNGREPHLQPSRWTPTSTMTFVNVVEVLESFYAAAPVTWSTIWSALAQHCLSYQRVTGAVPFA